MKWISSWLNKKKALKAYRATLSRYLNDTYGKSRNLEYQQVHNALNALSLGCEYESYAYAMALSKSQYKYYQKVSGTIYTQDALQIEMGVSLELLKTQHFSSGAN